MKNVALLIFIFVLSANSVVCQTYNEFVMQAKELYHAKKYQESYKVWDKAFNVHTGFASDYYDAACASALAGKTAIAFNYLEQAVKNGWEDINWMKKDSDLASLRESKKWSAFFLNIPKMKAAYLNSLNIDLKEKLESLRMQDQTIRLILPDVEKRFGRESKEYTWFRKELMLRNDSIVLNKTVDVIEQYGWLGINDVGELANQTLWLIIQHAPLDIQKKYLPLLEKSVNEGQSKGWYLAFLQDRILMREGEKQIYGTQSLWDKERKKNVIWPIADYKTVNQRRKEVGLESIEKYAENSGFIYEPQ